MNRYALMAGLLAWLVLAGPAQAVVEIGRQAGQVTRIEEVYQVDQVPYLAIDEVLSALGLTGFWHRTQHRYHLKLPAGTATFFPGGQYLKIGERFVALPHPARFIDGRLRVAESFVLEVLRPQLGAALYYRNLDPPRQQEPADALLDRLFSFVLRQKRPEGALGLRGVAIDPAHGGDDAGVIAGRVKEKDVVLQVAQQLERQIKMQLGCPVVLSRDADYSPPAAKRLEMLQQQPVDALLLLHAQGSLSPQAHGIHLYVVGGDALPPGATSPDSLRLALQLSAALREAGFAVAEVSQTTLLSLPQGDLPTVLIELGYLTRADEQTRLTETTGQQALAVALLEGLKDFSTYLQRQNRP